MPKKLLECVNCGWNSRKIKEKICNTLYFPVVRTHTCIYIYPILNYTLYIDLMWIPIHFHKLCWKIPLNRLTCTLNRFIIESIQPEPTVLNRFTPIESIQSCKYPISSSNARQCILPFPPTPWAYKYPPLTPLISLNVQTSLTFTYFIHIYTHSHTLYISLNQRKKETKERK